MICRVQRCCIKALADVPKSFFITTTTLKRHQSVNNNHLRTSSPSTSMCVKGKWKCTEPRVCVSVRVILGNAYTLEAASVAESCCCEMRANSSAIKGEPTTEESGICRSTAAPSARASADTAARAVRKSAAKREADESKQAARQHKGMSGEGVTGA